MSELVKERRKRKEELEEQLSRLRHVNEVDDALHLQVSPNAIVTFVTTNQGISHSLGKHYYRLNPLSYVSHLLVAICSQTT